jgi:predicted enzyme related to lactoylglutathione lyase
MSKESEIGQPSYIELGVPDTAAARVFYGRLLGWPDPSGDGPQEVTTPTLDIGLHSGDAQAHFQVFFAVEDIYSSLEKVVELGGRVVRPVQDVPHFGAFAECADDQGVRFGLRTLPS